MLYERRWYYCPTVYIRSINYLYLMLSNENLPTFFYNYSWNTAFDVSIKIKKLFPLKVMQVVSWVRSYTMTPLPPFIQQLSLLICSSLAKLSSPLTTWQWVQCRISNLSTYLCDLCDSEPYWPVCWVPFRKMIPWTTPILNRETHKSHLHIGIIIQNP
jgi:hypothetical protein